VQRDLGRHPRKKASKGSDLDIGHKLHSICPMSRFDPFFCGFATNSLPERIAPGTKTLLGKEQKTMIKNKC